jgi:hypothetical protein
MYHMSLDKANLILDRQISKKKSLLSQFWWCHEFCCLCLVLWREVLVVLSAICWCIWKIINELIFRQDSTPIKNMIYLIISLLQYWTRCKGKKVETISGYGSLKTWRWYLFKFWRPVPMLIGWCQNFSCIWDIQRWF